MESDPLSLPSTARPTIVNITSPETAATKISIPIGQVKTSSSSPSSPQSASATASGAVQHTFYKPRATSTSSARRSRAESLTNSLKSHGAGAAAAGTTVPTTPGIPNYPPSSTVSLSRPHSLSRSRPPSATYVPSASSVTPSASLTHTGGILPPASFFHPKQPPLSPAAYASDQRPPPLNANNVYAPPRIRASNGGGGSYSHQATGGRPSSGISSSSSSAGGQLTNMGVPLVSSTSSHAREHGLIMLPLSHIHSRHSDGSTSGPDLSSYSDSSQRRRLSNHSGPNARVKPSREALLPIGEKDTLTGSHHNNSTKSTHTGVRGSLEKIFRRATSSSERERNSPSPAPLSKEPPRTVMDDHARAASSLSVRLRRRSSANDGAIKSELPQQQQQQPETISAKPPLAVPVVSEAYPDPTEDVPEPAAFEGVALDGTRFTYGPERNWRSFPSRNTFFLNGRLLTGGDSPLAFIFSVSVVLGIAGTWFGTTAVWWWLHASPAVAAVGVYLCLLTMASMFMTAMRDPGILPRHLDIDPPYPDTPPADGGPRMPLPRDMRVRSGAVRVKYCVTCKIYRPPRSSHCKLCDNCVEGCDHHCPWVNNCIGRRNYTSFFTFLFFANTTLLLVIITSALHLWLLIQRGFVPDFVSALRAAPGSAAAFLMGVLVLGPVSALFFYHVRLMLLNVTTIEQVRNQAHRSIMPGPLPANPFTLNAWYRNLGYLMCRPVITSWIDGHGQVQHDLRLPNPGHDRSARMTNDGFDSDAFDHHNMDHSHDPTMWKGETDLEMEQAVHARE